MKCRERRIQRCWPIPTCFCSSQLYDQLFFLTVGLADQWQCRLTPGTEAAASHGLLYQPPAVTPVGRAWLPRSPASSNVPFYASALADLPASPFEPLFLSFSHNCVRSYALTALSCPRNSGSASVSNSVRVIVSGLQTWCLVGRRTSHAFVMLRPTPPHMESGWPPWLSWINRV